MESTDNLAGIAQRGRQLRVAIVTDAWYPQVNGVVRTLDSIRQGLTALGDRVEVIGPDRFTTFPCPTYPEIRLSVAPGRRLGRLLDEFQPDAIHLSTEGPLGIAARRYCLRRGRPFTTAFHTRFPEYVHARFGLSTRVTYGLVRWFHRPARHTMVATPSLAEELARRGFRNLTRWSRGVDTELFKPRDRNFLDLPRPISLYVGRVAVEKNIEAFLQLSLPGTKVVVGDGPQRTQLEREYPQAVFVGMKQGEALARHYAAADVFVFPSLTDTFGLVILEALACGVPVAAFPVTGPRDVIGDARVGCLDDDLQRAVTRALALDRQACRAFALNFSWAHSIRQFRSHLVVFPSSPSPDLTITSRGNPPPVPSAGDAPHI